MQLASRNGVQISLRSMVLLTAAVCALSFASTEFTRTGNFIPFLWPSSAIILVALIRTYPDLTDFSLQSLQPDGSQYFLRILPLKTALSFLQSLRLLTFWR